METDGILGIVVLVIVIVFSLWLFFDVLGFQPTGGLSAH